MEPVDDFEKMAPEGTTPVTEIDIKTLAEIYDERDVYPSAYLPTATS